MMQMSVGGPWVTVGRCGGKEGRLWKHKEGPPIDRIFLGGRGSLLENLGHELENLPLACLLDHHLEQGAPMIDRTKLLKQWIHEAFDPVSSACRFCSTKIKSANTTRKKKVRGTPPLDQHCSRFHAPPLSGSFVALAQLTDVLLPDH